MRLMDLFAPSIGSVDPFCIVKLLALIAGFKALVVLTFSEAPVSIV